MTESDGPTRKLKVEIEITDQFLSDILTTAVEGGSAYWLMAERVDRADKDHACLDHLSAIAVIGPIDADEGGGKFSKGNFREGFEGNRDNDITLDTIYRGLERLFEPGVLPFRDDIRQYVVGLDPGNLDADCADVILQLGYFGDLVYG